MLKFILPIEFKVPYVYNSILFRTNKLLQIMEKIIVQNYHVKLDSVSYRISKKLNKLGTFFPNHMGNSYRFCNIFQGKNRLNCNLLNQIFELK